MDDQALSESEAFTFIRDSAMRRRTTMRAIAREVVEGGLAP